MSTAASEPWPRVEDIPPISVQVCEHRAQIKICPCCSLRNKAEFAVLVTQSVQYGNELQAVAAFLSQYQMVPFKRLQELFNDVLQAVSDREAMGILDGFEEYAVPDHWASYNAFDCCHVLCNARQPP